MCHAGGPQSRARAGMIVMSHVFIRTLLCRYSGGYWEARAASANGDATGWANCPDIFGLGSKYGDVTQLLGSLAI